MTQDEPSYSAEIVVGNYDGQKVFCLDGLRLPSLPAALLSCRTPLSVMFHLFREKGGVLPVVVTPSTGAQNNVSYNPSHFIIRDFGDYNAERRQEYLLAEHLDEGDRVRLSNLSPLLRMFLLYVLAPRFERYADFYQRFVVVCERHRQTKLGSDAETECLHEVSVLLAELKDQPEWPSTFELVTEDVNRV